MNLKDVGIVIGQTLESHMTIDNKYVIVYFPRVGTKISKEVNMLVNSIGVGKNIDEAKAGYALEISGRIIVANSTNKENRLEIQLPDNITV